jgi:hypothetical protein
MGGDDSDGLGKPTSKGKKLKVQWAPTATALSCGRAGRLHGGSGIIAVCVLET